MTGDDLLLEAEGNMESAVNALLERFKGIRTSRATPEMVDSLRVEYYGTSTPIKSLAVIQIPEANCIVLKPFDASVLKEIEKVIATSELGVTPQNDGKILRVILPPLSQERRKKYADVVKTQAEESRVSLRNARRDAKKAVDAGKKEGEFPEDDAERLHEAVQKLTDEYMAKLEDLVKRKTEEILKV